MGGVKLSDYMVKSLVDFSKVIELLSSEDRKMGLSEMADTLEMNKTRLFRILSTCVELGMVEQIGMEYILGWKLFELGQKVLSVRGFRSNTHGILESFRDTVNETVNLGILVNADVLLIDVAESSYNLNASFKIGSHLPPHLTSIGKAILSSWEAEEIIKLLSNRPFLRHTPRSVTNLQSLVSQLSEFRQKGWAIDDEEYAEGIRCVAAPIDNRMGKAVASVSFSGPVVRMTMEKIENAVPDLLDTAEKISATIGGCNFFA